MSRIELDEQILTDKDFASDQDVRWCPGCGDYSILAQMKRVLPKLNIPREKIIFISGIGCSSRFPYYLNTYGIHSIHGRAPTLATGLKATRPDLSVFVITGDGDALSIGGNHFIHAIRRNIDIKIILFNNRIYGLTKGQYSPTSEQGKVTKSSPYGALDFPIRPISVAIGAEASFVARAIDVHGKHLAETLERAARHKGTAFVEVYQNCVIFNNGAFKYATEKGIKEEAILELEHGKPMIFGKNSDKGIRISPKTLSPEVVTVGKDGVTLGDILVHDEKAAEPTLAYFLSRFAQPSFPEPIGVFRAVRKPTYDELFSRQIEDARVKSPSDLQSLIEGDETWEVKA